MNLSPWEREIADRQDSDRRRLRIDQDNVRSEYFYGREFAAFIFSAFCSAIKQALKDNPDCARRENSSAFGSGPDAAAFKKAIPAVCSTLDDAEQYMTRAFCLLDDVNVMGDDFNSAQFQLGYAHAMEWGYRKMDVSFQAVRLNAGLSDNFNGQAAAQTAIYVMILDNLSLLANPDNDPQAVMAEDGLEDMKPLASIEEHRRTDYERQVELEDLMRGDVLNALEKALKPD